MMKKLENQAEMQYLLGCKKAWKNTICKKHERDNNAMQSVIGHGYNINDETEELERRYLELAMGANG